jgi:3-hydroxybutyryl-CoA dehydrogenase
MISLKIKRAAVIGAGTMGSGIAHVLALNGIGVVLIEASAPLLGKAMAGISINLDRQIKKGIVDGAAKEKALSKITTALSLEEAKNAQIVIEAVPENLALKKDIFSKLSSLCDPHAILATNTSSISITALAASVKNPERVIGMHFMNPVPMMKLIEIIRGLQTSDETHQCVRDLALRLGKHPVASNDFPGFISNRILMPLINEACFTLMEGVASKEDIDTVMKLGMNHPMGPLELADFIGLDVCLNILNVLLEGFGDPKYRPCPLLKQMVAAGRLGRKTAQGFYDYA